MKTKFKDKTIESLERLILKLKRSKKDVKSASFDTSIDPINKTTDVLIKIRYYPNKS